MKYISAAAYLCFIFIKYGTLKCLISAKAMDRIISKTYRQIKYHRDGQYGKQIFFQTYVPVYWWVYFFVIAHTYVVYSHERSVFSSIDLAVEFL